MPSTRTLTWSATALAVLSLAGTVAAQSPIESEFGLGARLGIRFGVALLVNLVLGAALTGLAPRYARERAAAIRDDLGGAFVWGLIVGIGVPIALVVLAITIIGLVITIPGLIALFFVGLVGNAVTICWLGSALTGDETLGAAAVGAGAFVLSILAAIPVLGNLATTLLGFFGLGVVGRDLYTSWQG